MISETMTKREFFAAMAMQGLCANHLTDMDRTSEVKLAHFAIEFADALIDELKQNTLESNQTN